MALLSSEHAQRRGAPAPTTPEKKDDNSDGFLLAGAAVLLGVGGYFGWEWLHPKTVSPSATPTPTPTPQPGNTPTPTSTPTPVPVDPFLAWWGAAPEDQRQAISVYWCLLGQIPTFAGSSTYPIGEMQNEEARASGTLAQCAGMSPIQGVAYRIVTDSQCEFFDVVDSAVGGPGCNPGCAGYGQNPCGAIPYSGVAGSWPGPSMAANWLAKAVSMLIRTVGWTPTDAQMANWVSAKYCGQTVNAWQNAVIQVGILSAQFTDVIAAMATGSEPPWYGWPWGGSASEPPSVATQAASEVTSTSATLNAVITPNGRDTTYGFQIMRNGTVNWAFVCEGQDAGSGVEPVAVSCSTSDLTPGFLYVFQPFAYNEPGQVIVGAMVDFTTPGA